MQKLIFLKRADSSVNLCLHSRTMKCFGSRLAPIFFFWIIFLNAASLFANAELDLSTELDAVFLQANDDENAELINESQEEKVFPVSNIHSPLSEPDLSFPGFSGEPEEENISQKEKDGKDRVYLHDQLLLHWIESSFSRLPFIYYSRRNCPVPLFVLHHSWKSFLI